MTSPLRDRRSAALVAALLGALVFANSLANGFAYDDVHVILENEGIKSLSTLPEAVVKPYWHAHDEDVSLGLWRPTTTLVLGLEYALAGESPAVYHLMNVLGHAVASGLVVLLLAHLAPTAVALVAGLLFAVHPVHVEAVANVIGGADVLAALLVLVALLLHLGGTSTWGRAAAVGAVFALAFGAKENAVTLPALIFLVDAARRRIGFAEVGAYLREVWRTYAVVGVVGGAMLLLRARVLGSVASPDAALGSNLLLEVPRIWTLAEVWGHYVRLMVFPLDLASDYSPAVIPVSIGWGAANLTGLLLALGALAGALAAWRRESTRLVGVGVVWFLVAVSPVANVVFLSGVLLAERTLYLPSIGAVAVLAWALVALGERRREVGVAVVAAAVLLMAVRSWSRTPTWKDDATVFETLIAEYPQSGRSQWLMGDIYMADGRPSEALMAYRQAIPNVGAHWGLTTQIGRKLMNAGNLRGAAHLLERVRKEAPDLGTAPALLGVIYTRMEAWEDAERALADAVRLQPENTVSHHLRATSLERLERWEEAAAARREVIARGEDVWQQWFWLGQDEARAGDAEAAREALDEARDRGAPEEEVTRVLEEMEAPPGR